MPDFSVLPGRLLGSAGKRHLVLLEGLNIDQSNSILSELARIYGYGSESPVIYTPFMQRNKIKEILGTDQSLAVIDFSESIHPSLLGIVSGTVIGGGVLVLIVPSGIYWPAVSIRHAPWCDSQSDYNISRSTLAEIWHQRLTSISEKIQVTPENFASSLQMLIESKTVSRQGHEEIVLNPDQLLLVRKVSSSLRDQRHSSILIRARRGRGKSTAVSQIVSMMLTLDQRVGVCAPRKASASRQLDSSDGRQAEYFPVEDLLRNSLKLDLLILEEAAALPYGKLLAIIRRYPKTILVTTLEGYEGSGRSISTGLELDLADCGIEFTTFDLTVPVRWIDQDPVEHLVDELLLQKYFATSTNAHPDLSSVETRWCKQIDKVDERWLVKAVELLASAHYRTRPEDIWQWMDDPGLEVIIQRNQTEVISVCCIQIESPDWTSLPVNEIYSGRRRPTGLLSTQTLIFQLGLKEICDVRIARIIRVATHPGCRRQGRASELLNTIESSLQGRVDLLTASFGVRSSLMQFWQQNSFLLGRVGLKRNPVSGNISAFMIKPVSKYGRNISDQVEQRFANSWDAFPPRWRRSVGFRLRKFINNSALCRTLNKVVPEQESVVRELEAFAYGHRNIENSIFVLKEAFSRIEQQVLKHLNDRFQPDSRLWYLLICYGCFPEELNAQGYSLSRREAINRFRQQVQHYLSQP